MKIEKAHYEILTDLSDPMYGLKAIERAARTCYKSEGAITEDGESAKRLVKNLVFNNHLAMLEHAPQLSVKFFCSRAVSHEIVRHRLFSFAEMSQRYCNFSSTKFGGDITFIDPRPAMLLDQKMQGLTEVDRQRLYEEWHRVCSNAEESYNRMISMGASPQCARTVLPNSTKTEIVVTGNYREWINAFTLRCSPAAEPAMRELMIPLFEEIKSKIPVVFDYISL